ncbi:hypothetical protein DPMN_138267 [Dreissena polymorpha]|uniref:Uncharacterized protein n=1 Tax=Dreissena polymorpha TaxID=45954 RepID=A0A9D4JEH3_DREPO|nr:hypothetical protein DPMN_138267 [Dreissena polymorpha]
MPHSPRNLTLGLYDCPRNLTTPLPQSLHHHYSNLLEVLQHFFIVTTPIYLKYIWLEVDYQTATLEYI